MAQRKSHDFLTFDEKHKVEKNIGKAAFEAITKFKIPGEEDVEGAVWKREGPIVGNDGTIIAALKK